MDISSWVAHWGNVWPGKTALRFEGRAITYGQLERRVAETAGWLHARGVSRGDRVAFLGQNCPELLELFFASARAGAIFVPLNARMPAAELRVFVGHSRPRLLVAEQSLSGVAAASVSEPTGIGVASFEAGRGLDHLTRGAPPLAFDPTVEPQALVLIAFTSGTTGPPKGATFSHANLTMNALGTVATLGLAAPDEILNVAPMFHVVGLALLTLPGLCAGATVTIHRQFDPARFLADVERLRINLVASVPTMTLAMAAHPAWAGADLTSLRCVLTGSSLVRPSAVEPWLQKGVPVLQGYGLTETLPGGGTIVPPGGGREKVLTAGKPKLHHQVRVVDSSGQDLPAGDPGEVWIAGPCVMQGYWEDPAATREAFRDGWFRTGDVGFFDQDGYLHLVDRIKDIVIIGASNVYPSDLEAVLAECREIKEAVVVGRPDHELGEVPVACVVAAEGSSITAAEIFGLFQNRLAAYKHPRDVVFLDKLPRNAMGKVLRGALRDLVRSKEADSSGRHSKGGAALACTVGHAEQFSA